MLAFDVAETAPQAETEAQKRKRLAFAKTRENWTILQCTLFQAPKRQNDRVYAHSSHDVHSIETETDTQDHGLGMVSYRGLSELHNIPRG